MSSSSLSSLSNLLKVAERIDKTLLDSGYFEIKSKDFVLRSLEHVMRYSIVATLGKKTDVGRNISFENFDLSRISITASPGFLNQKQSVAILDTGMTRSFVLDPNKLDKDADEFNFAFDVECDVEKITSDLVRRDHQIETSTDEKSTYWLSAQLKELEKIAPLLRRMDLSDIPFAVNVAVYQDVKTKFPMRRQRELDLIAQWARELDRNRKRILNHQHIQLKRERPKEKDITKMLIDLQAIFIPHRFKSFIDVLRDFQYDDCLRGAEFYEQIPFRTFPKWMSVICRTDISTENPASEGELVYKKAKFQEAVEKAITEK